MSLKKSFISGVKWNSLGITSRALFQVLQIAILTRFLPKEDFGLIAMALVVIQFSNIFLDMGMTTAVLHKQNISKTEFSSIYWLNIFISFILYTLLFISSPLVAQFYNQVELNTIIPVLGLNILIIASGKLYQTIFQKEMRFNIIAKIEILSSFIALISAITLAYYEFGVYSLIYSTLLKSIISNSLFIAFGSQRNPLTLFFKLKETKPFLRIGGFTMGSTLLDFFSRETDILIIGKLLGPEDLGIYSLSKQLVLRLFSSITPIILNVLSPLLSKIQNDTTLLKSSFLKTIKYLAFINFPIYLVIIIASKEILGVIYGSQYMDAQNILICLAFSYAITALSNPIGSLQIATGRTDLGLKWTIIRVIVTPVFIYLGALHNIETVAFFYSLLTLGLIIPLWYFQMKPMIQITFKDYFSQFINNFIIFIISISSLLFLNNLEVYNLVFTGILKALISITIFGSLQLLLNKKGFYEVIKGTKSMIKR